MKISQHARTIEHIHYSEWSIERIYFNFPFHMFSVHSSALHSFLCDGAMARATQINYFFLDTQIECNNKVLNLALLCFTFDDS